VSTLCGGPAHIVQIAELSLGAILSFRCRPSITAPARRPDLETDVAAERRKRWTVEIEQKRGATNVV
jgi:hypothetical protein